MLSEDLHISDQDLLLAADGELSTRRAGQIRAHLAACWSCRARMAEMEGTITEFTLAHRQILNPELPPIAGPRALLRAEISGLSRESKVSPYRLISWTNSAARAAAVCLTLLAAALISGLFFRQSVLRATGLGDASFDHSALPERSLTPGAARSVTIENVCSMAHEEVVRDVSSTMRQEVLQEYGIMDARAADYEIDFLIAPGLGGTEDIHNLWPQSYKSSTWNANVKDALEERLHDLVCAGDLDLSIAQRDIATDWIAAYKKYFHTDRPLSLHSRLGPANPPDFTQPARNRAKRRDSTRATLLSLAVQKF